MPIFCPNPAGWDSSHFLQKRLSGEKILRGPSLEDAGKELTYADALTGNMRTAAGKQMAAEKRTFTLDYFQSLFLELKKDGIADLRFGTFRSPARIKGRGYCGSRLSSLRHARAAAEAGPSIMLSTQDSNAANSPPPSAVLSAQPAATSPLPAGNFPCT